MSAGMGALRIIRHGQEQPCRPWPRHVLDRGQWAALIEALATTPELALLALWAEPAMVHACFLMEGEGSVIIASCAAPEGRYPALSPVRPGALRFERTIRDLWGLVAEDAVDLRPWLDHGRWPVIGPLSAGPAANGLPPPQPEFRTVEGEGVHQIPVGPVHAGIIEPGHFRFHVQGETAIRFPPLHLLVQRVAGIPSCPGPTNPAWSRPVPGHGCLCRRCDNSRGRPGRHGGTNGGATCRDQPVVEPGQQPGQLIVIPVNDAGDPLPGACFAVVEFGFEACDDDGDGTVVFDAVPPSPLTLRETAPPPGYAAIADLPINIEPTGAQLLIPHQPAGATQPTEVPQIQPAETPQAQPAETPRCNRSRHPRSPPAQDRSCSPCTIEMATPSPAPAGDSLHKERSGVTSAVTLTTGLDDGQIVFDAVAAGRYRLEEVTTPQGFQPADEQGIDVSGDAPTEVTVEYRLAQGHAGRLVTRRHR